MICPHCAERPRYKELPGRTRPACRRTFALDPRHDTPRLSDAKVRHIVAKLTDDGRMKTTVSRLRFSATRSTMRTRTRKKTWEVAGPAPAYPVLGVGLLGLGLSTGRTTLFLTITGGLIRAFTVVITITTLMESGPFPEPNPISCFRGPLLMDNWPEGYGSSPDGVVADARTGIQDFGQPAFPRAVLLCPDRHTLVFLAANGIPGRLGVVLAARVRDLSDAVPGVPAVPVVVPHDADTAGCLLASRTRAELPGREVVDAGLPPRAVMNRRGAVPVCRAAPARADLRAPRGTGTLTKDEPAWRRKGWTSSLIGVPPALLLAGVTKIVERAIRTATMATAVGGDLRAADGLAFLSWPDGATTLPEGPR
ncbi:hypothetical protein ACIOWG_02450 [Streptomyces sp. NPDC087658]|uniref:hypothetical protein n=1 Tax=Streptomyces sp. NPDC087658 TaxID=3365800 RepID=UPI00381942FE